MLGVEVDGDYSSLTGSLPTTFCPNGSCSTNSDWLGTVRGRVGYAFDRILLNTTAGGAYGNIQAIANGVSNSNSEFGWTAGAGIEAALARNWTVKVEYLYVDLANGSCTTACGAPPTQSVSLTESLVRAKLRPGSIMWNTSDRRFLSALSSCHLDIIGLRTRWHGAIEAVKPSSPVGKANADLARPIGQRLAPGSRDRRFRAC